MKSFMRRGALLVLVGLLAGLTAVGTVGCGKKEQVDPYVYASLRQVMTGAVLDTVGRQFAVSQIKSDTLDLSGPAVTQDGAQHGAWYKNVETLQMQLGSGGDFVGIDATGPDSRTVPSRITTT